MELLSQTVVVGHLTIEISVHDISYRMGLREGAEPRNHLFVNLSARDNMGKRVWVTPLLSDDGKIMAFSTVSEALGEAKRRVGAEGIISSLSDETRNTTTDPSRHSPNTDLQMESKKDTHPGSQAN
jgi:hypothetical protein